MTITLEPKAIASAIRLALAVNATERLFTVVDACQAPELIELARTEFKQPVRMLFKGKAAALEEVESFAPFFIAIDLETDFLEYWAAYWYENAGVLFTSAAEPRVIFRHLRRIFIVQDESGQEYFFRFYDPRVLRTYLPTCTNEEKVNFHGPITGFMFEGPSFIEMKDAQCVNLS